MNIELRRAIPSDAEELTKLAFASKRYWGYPEEWIELWADDLSVNADYIETNFVFTANHEARILGWVSVTPGGEELDYCWVDPEFIGRGVGSELVKQAVKIAYELNSAKLKVVSDPNAERFYKNAGFQRTGEHASVPNGRLLPVMELQCRP